MTHNLFVGIVIASTAGSYTATIVREAYTRNKSADAGFRVQGIVVSSVFANFFGFKENVILQPGCRVLCVGENSEKCYVLGVIPDEDYLKKGEDIEFANRSILGPGCATDDKANRTEHVTRNTLTFSARRPTDAVDGEYEVGNELGVLLGLYQQLAVLKGSELSQVQCHLLDDLVRIISHNFQHYTALGEYNIYHDGKSLMAEFGATHLQSEMYGSPSVENEAEKSIFTENEEHTLNDAKDFYEIEGDERIKAIERFKLFLGSVGDFIHMFVVRPHPSAKRILDANSEDISPDTGLCNLHVGTDGGVHLRSVKEVFIEKTNWIKVPIRVAAPEDPNGDNATQLNYEPKETFEFNNAYKYKDNPTAFGLQIRDYVTYVNEKLNYQNFKTHKKDFFVNDDIDKEEKINDIGNVDPKTPLGLNSYKLSTAGIYLMPNGGITIKDAWNSAIVMEGGNIYLQPAKDLLNLPLRHHISKVGGSYSLACQQHIDISSTNESLRLKTKNSIHLFSQDSGILLESAKLDLAEQKESEAIQHVAGIIFKSKGDVTTFSQEGNVVSHAAQKIILNSLRDINLLAQNNTNLYTKENFYSFAKGYDNYSESNNTIAKKSAFFAGENTSIGKKNSPVSMQQTGFSFKGLRDTKDIQQSYEEKKEILADSRQTFQTTNYKDLPEDINKLKFKFLDSNNYYLQTADFIPITLAQQDDKISNLYSLEVWREEEVNDSYPYPGKNLFDNFLMDAPLFTNLEKGESNLKDLKPKKELNPKAPEMKLTSLNEYRVNKFGGE